MSLLLRISANKPHFRHALRVVVAASLAYGLNLWLGFEQGYWMVFTAIIVMQGSVGGSVKAAMERMTGTLAGAFYGVLILAFVPHDTHGLFMLSIVLALGPMAVAASLWPAFRIAPITVAILMFGNGGQQYSSPLQYAEWRVFEICIGCVIGLVTALIVTPARAHNILANAAAEALDMIAIELSQLLASQPNSVAMIGSHKKLRQSLSKLEDIAGEARRETASYLSAEPDPEPLLRMVRRIRNDLIMISRAVDKPLPMDEKLAHNLAIVSKGSAEILNAVSNALKNDKPMGAMPNMDEAFAASSAAIRTISRDEEELSHAFALAFALEQLKRNLKDLSARADDFITAN